MLSFLREGVLTLAAAATLSLCSAGVAIEFSWDNPAQSPAGVAELLPLATPAVQSAGTPTLRLPGVLLTSGVTYTLRCCACVAVAGCAAAEVEVRLLDEDLRGAIVGRDQLVSRDSALLLNACPPAVLDPDEPLAVLAYAWGCNRFTRSTGVALGACAFSPPDPSACAWELPPASRLTFDAYHFRVRVSTSSGQAVSSKVVITASANALPSVAIVP